MILLLLVVVVVVGGPEAAAQPERLRARARAGDLCGDLTIISPIIPEIPLKFMKNPCPLARVCLTIQGFV